MCEPQINQNTILYRRPLFNIIYAFATIEIETDQIWSTNLLTISKRLQINICTL